MSRATWLLAEFKTIPSLFAFPELLESDDTEFVMPACVCSLEDLKRKGQGLEGPSCENYVQIISAIMAEFHAQGIVHHNLKPNHILITLDNRIILCDWAQAYFPNSDIPFPPSFSDYTVLDRL
eukprot:c14769_g1_i2.p1 GENE.c14769_g1_i2~~c14769_g1_i2.p1  ORF type:complete len:123 (-),score=18.05 c14769_g1_i2:79-447(-)